MTREEARQKASELVAQMTVEEAASQLRYDAPEIPRLNIPAYNWWSEALHGVARAGTATCFPQAIGMGATFDVDLVHKIAQAISLETRAKYNSYSTHGERGRYQGVTMWAPNINIFRDPRWGRGQETFGEDPVLTANLGCAVIEGLQTKKGGYMTAAACAKHFAVHSGPELLRHEFNAEVTEKDLWETYLPAFEACVKDAKVEAVMGAYNRTNGEPCCAHSYLMEDILRGRWKFQGHYVSDCWAIRDFHEHHHITAFPEDSAALALQKGCDLNCGCTYQTVMQAFKQDKIEESDIRQSAVRLFTTRYLLGLFDHSELDEIPYNVVGSREHLQLAYQAAVESCVLLKNDGILPLNPHTMRTIAVVGPNADSKNALIGNYYGTPPRCITIYEGIRAVCDTYGLPVLYAEGCRLYDDVSLRKPHDRYHVAEAGIVAENADLIIACVGLDATVEGEQMDTGNEFAGGDKKDLLLPKCQRDLLDRIKETGKPFLIINASGSPIDLSEYEESASAILQVWYPGGEGGLAAADILFGKISPSGKLPVTFYSNENKLPDFTDYNMTGRTYRYLKEKPWKPFGFGLTYGKPQVEAMQINNAAACTVTCSNKGEFDISDVLQIYVHMADSQNEVPNPKLAAFKRISLKAGEEKKISIAIPPQAFTTVDENGSRRSEGTQAEIYAGFCQPSEAAAKEAMKINFTACRE